MRVVSHRARRGWLAPGLLFLALLGGCDAPPPAAPQRDAYGNLIGPVYSAAALSAHALLGVRLRMASEAAEAALVSRGFTLIFRDPAQIEAERERPVRLRRFWISRAPGTDAYEFPEYVTLSYVQQDDGGWIVAAISHHERIPAAQRRDAAATRGELLRRFGQPSLWKQEVYRGELWDEMDYVAAPLKADRDGLDSLRACHQDWQCERVLKKNDCRITMRAGRGVALKISFTSGGNRIHFDLSDYGLLHDHLLRWDRFRRMDVRGAFCSVPSPGGGVPTVVTVPG